MANNEDVIVMGYDAEGLGGMEGFENLANAQIFAFYCILSNNSSKKSLKI